MSSERSTVPQESNSPLQGYQERVDAAQDPCTASAQPSSPSGSSTSAEEQGGAPGRRPNRRVNFTGERFRGFLESSQRGTHPVIRYPIPGGSLCYTFEHLRTTTQGRVVYRCIGCKKDGRTTSVAVTNGCELVGDPVFLPHICRPLKNAQDKVQRMVYETCRKLPLDPRNAYVKPRQLWQKLAEQVHYEEGADANERDDMLYYFHRHGYEARRRTLARATAKLHDRRVSMDQVPPEYAVLPDGTAFLQHSSPEVHVYYSTPIIEKACDLGLYALVGDGVHDMQPDATNKLGQLYTIHGVLRTGEDVPLLYAVTTRKNRRMYDLLFGMLRDAINSGRGTTRLRIILDYERAAINAAKGSFPRASVEGCAFHLAQAWNRKRDALGLTPLVSGGLRNRCVQQWWHTIKGLVFLPKHLHRRVPGLFRPTFSREHGAYDKCAMFLEYLHSNWYEGMFRNMWNKWDLHDLRTSNIAESYHNALKKLLNNVKYPRMSDLLNALRGYVTTSRGKLLDIERNNQSKKLRKKDRLRRRRIRREMERFKQLLIENRTFLHTRIITRYCRRMSRFVTDKTV